MPINPNIINEVIDVTSDKISNFYDRLYQTPIGKWIDSNLMGDFKLSDEEYYNKYGYARPLGGVGYAIGDIGGLGSLKKELEAVEKAKELQKVKQAKKNKEIIDQADNVITGTRTGRPHLVIKNNEGSGIYEKVEYVPRERISPVVKETTETEKKIDKLNRAINFNRSEYQRLLMQGNRERDVRNLEWEYQRLKSQLERLSPPDYRFKDGGKLKRK